MDRIAAAQSAQQPGAKLRVGRGPEAEIAVCPLSEVEKAKGSLVLCEVLDTAGRAQVQGIDLVARAESNPAEGSALIEKFAQDVASTIEAALEGGADGFLYRITTAHPFTASPMTYGGYFLEVDRALLAAFENRAVRFLFIEGDSDAYFDIVSDLPAEAFGWDADFSGISVHEMRPIRHGLLFANDFNADFGSSLTTSAKEAAHA